MRSLTAAELLEIWEQGTAQPPARRALMLLAAANPETSVDELAGLSIGQRDARLLTLRELTFGSQLVSVASCPECGERLELAFDATDLRAVADTAPPGTMTMHEAGYDVTVRLPNSHDLLALPHTGDVGPTTLLARCLLEATSEGAGVAVEALPDAVVDAIVARMAEADPQADVQLVLTCPTCVYEWQATFDIVSFFWSELTTWAQRTLQDVHVLASAYGWREADVLAMSPRRRQHYLSMVLA